MDKMIAAALCVATMLTGCTLEFDEQLDLSLSEAAPSLSLSLDAGSLVAPKDAGADARVADEHDAATNDEPDAG